MSHLSTVTAKKNTAGHPVFSFPLAWLCFCIGFLGYPLLEIAVRGYSHPSMALCGGLVCLFAYCLSLCRLHTLEKSLLLTLFILILELLFGLLFNILLHEEVWDYSNLRFHFYGQISLLYTVLWFVASLVIFRVSSGFVHIIRDIRKNR